jgi:tape measure domain-containing protein
MATTATTTIKVVADTTQAQRALGDLQSTLGRLVSIAAVAALTKQFVDLADASTNLTNKLALVTQSGQTASQLFNVMAQSAIGLGAPMKEVGDLFFRVANNTRDLGLTQTQQVKITETLIKGFQLTGASAGEVSGGVIQLGQAFAVGTLRGDELNSVMESLPMVAQALADKFGVQTGALKKLGEQGKISSKDLSDAILSSGVAIDKAYMNKLPTVANAFNAVSNAIQVQVNQIDKSTGASETLAIALVRIATAVIQVMNKFDEWGATLSFVLKILGAFAAMSVIGRIFGMIGGAVTGVSATFAKLAKDGQTLTKTVGMTGEALVKWKSGIIPNVNILLEVLGRRMTFLIPAIAGVGKALSELGGFIATFLGLNYLFSKEQSDGVKTYADEVARLNAALGITKDVASEAAKAPSGGKTAQQVDQEKRVTKALQDRGEALKDIIKTQEESLGLTKYEGTELKIQEALTAANSKLIKEIRDDQGAIVGYTAGLTAAEGKVLENLVLQTLQRELARDIVKQMTDTTMALNLAQNNVASMTSEQLGTELQVLAARQQYGKLLTPQLENQIRTTEQNKINLKLTQDLADLNKTLPASEAQLAFVKANAGRLTAEQLDTELKVVEARQRYGALLTPELEKKMRGIEANATESKQLRELADLSKTFTVTKDNLALAQSRIGQSTNEQLDTEFKILAAQTKYGSLLTDEIKQKMRSTDESARQLEYVKSLNSALLSQAPLGGIQAGIQAAGAMAGLDPVRAAQTANETLYNGLKYLRDQDLISEQAYQTARVSAAVNANALMMDAQTKMYEQRKLFELQSQQNTIFGYEQQKGIATESAKFEMQSQYEKTQFGIQQGAALFSSLGAQNKKAFEASKALNIASAIMNTYAGATKALATYPWPFGLIAAAAAVAAGMAQVSAIRSQQYSGRALGGPVMGNKPYIVGERGPEVFTPSTSGSITPNNQLTGGGSTNVTFVIQAVDTAGFDQLLTSRRGLITQIISDAQLERGRRA